MLLLRLSLMHSVIKKNVVSDLSGGYQATARPKNTRDLSNDVYVTRERDATRPIFHIISSMCGVFFAVTYLQKAASDAKLAS